LFYDKFIICDVFSINYTSLNIRFSTEITRHTIIQTFSLKMHVRETTTLMGLHHGR